jgi:ubiquinone biosynthesis protein COQ9
MTEHDHAREARIIEGFWAVVAEHGWRGTSMARVATAAHMTLAELRAHASCPEGLLALSVRATDRAVLEGTVPTEGESPRDRLFDVLMRRLDELQKHRAGVVRFLRDLPWNPPLAIGTGVLNDRAMRWMLEAAGISTAGLAGQARRRGLMGVWTYTLRAWAKDESADLSATMAALDKALDRADQLARSLDPDARQASQKPAEATEPQ